ncbi:MAG: response regulator [Elusimicrobiales bacterium]|jgi:DNA-binding response OmpR family regulator|nr:response regulator [Elusimicrobiales bacterium]NLH39517.1 response regulator [Elusimicrobiota bacterium]
MENKIAIVDDNESILASIESILKDNGYDVKCYNDPLGVVEKIREYLPSLIMLDIHMPGKNGIELLKEIKGDSVLKKIPVVMLTVEGSPSEIQLSMLYGANTYILKPAKKDDILNVVKNILIV